MLRCPVADHMHIIPPTMNLPHTPICTGEMGLKGWSRSRPEAWSALWGLVGVARQGGNHLRRHPSRHSAHCVSQGLQLLHITKSDDQWNASSCPYVKAQVVATSLRASICGALLSRQTWLMQWAVAVRRGVTQLSAMSYGNQHGHNINP